MNAYVCICACSRTQPGPAGPEGWVAGPSTRARSRRENLAAWFSYSIKYVPETSSSSCRCQEQQLRELLSLDLNRTTWTWIPVCSFLCSTVNRLRELKLYHSRGSGNRSIWISCSTGLIHSFHHKEKQQSKTQHDRQLCQAGTMADDALPQKRFHGECWSRNHHQFISVGVKTRSQAPRHRWYLILPWESSACGGEERRQWKLWLKHHPWYKHQEGNAYGAWGGEAKQKNTKKLSSFLLGTINTLIPGCCLSLQSWYAKCFNNQYDKCYVFD